MIEKNFFFPKDFLLGVGTSSYQTEGNNKYSDWWEFEKIPGKIETGEQCGIATDHWNRYEQDFQLVKAMNCKIYRMSIEWSRIFPKEGVIDIESVNHYHKMFDWLIKNRIKIMLTTHHFTLPIWLANKGGLKNENNILFYEDYVRFLAKEYKNKIDYWCTINEPIILAFVSYYRGIFPPCEKNLKSTQKVINNLLRMHASAYEILKLEYNIKQVGIVKAMHDIEILSENSEDQKMAEFMDYFTNKSFLNALKTGRLPHESKEYIPILKESFDFLGINYYHRLLFSSKHFPDGSSPKLPNSDSKYLFTDHEWQPYPAGLFKVLKRISKITDKPIFITENGIATENDVWRQYFIISHLVEISRAIQRKINVRGYVHWTLTDNFEWAKGFNPRFGLVHIDYKTLDRKIKDSGKLYGKICGENMINLDDIKRLDEEFPDIDESMKIRYDNLV